MENSNKTEEIVSQKKADVYLFTSPTCPHCPSAKDFISDFRKERKDFTLHDLSTMTPTGQSYARKFGVMSVPTFIIKGAGNPDYLGLKGTPSGKTMNKYLDMSLGKHQEEPERKKKSLKEKMKEGIKIGKYRIRF